MKGKPVRFFFFAWFEVSVMDQSDSNSNQPFSYNVKTSLFPFSVKFKFDHVLTHLLEFDKIHTLYSGFHPDKLDVPPDNVELFFQVPM